MSRSRKKTPSCHIVGRQGGYKKIFNRRLRRNVVMDGEGVSSVPDGGAYRRANETWDIDDWHDTHLTLDGFRRTRELRGAPVDGEACRNDYEKWYLRK